MYIALYPPPLVGSVTNDVVTDSVVTSPSKLGSPGKMRQRRSSMFPTPAASNAALRLLTAFCLTNTPGVILDALPNYDNSTPIESSHNPADTEEDSFVAHESACFNECRCCWDILKEGFVRRKKDEPYAEKGKRRKRQKLQDDDEYEYDLGVNIAAPVGRQAWPLLELLIQVFEKDEILNGGELSCCKLI
jgi:hypothetical protein